jgi:hypothetical protein
MHDKKHQPIFVLSVIKKIIRICRRCVSKIATALNCMRWVSKIINAHNKGSLFLNKQVLIVGPNIEDESDFLKLIDAADVVVFVNKGHRSKFVSVAQSKSKILVLSHCMIECETAGGGSCNTWELRKKGFTEIICPFSGAGVERNIKKVLSHNFGLLPLLQISAESFKQLVEDVKGFIPNCGYATIWWAAYSGASTVMVSGFDFLRHPYNSSYHSFDRSYADTIKLIEKYRVHNPDYDLDSFKRLIEQFNIKMDARLEDVVNKPTEYIFYRGDDSQAIGSATP